MTKTNEPQPTCSCEASSSAPDEDMAWLVKQGRMDVDPISGARRDAAEFSSAPSDWLVQLLRQDRLHALHNSDVPLPVGSSLYASQTAAHAQRIDPLTGEVVARNRPGRNYEAVDSRYAELGTRDHSVGEAKCEHRLLVDDGALFTVETDPYEGYLVKTGQAVCTSSKPHRRSDGSWGSTDTWQIPCGQDAWELTLAWEPDKTRWRRGDSKPAENLTQHERAHRDLRPLSRADGQPFADVAHQRNSSESYNNWVKDRYSHKGRANTDSTAAQAFDYMAAGCLMNAITWRKADLD